MKQKYIDEKFEPYIIFGDYPSGNVDLASASNPTIVSDISRSEAELLIRQRQQMLNMLYALAEDNPKGFGNVWYEQ